MKKSSWLPLEFLNMVCYPYFRNQFWFVLPFLSVVKMCIYRLFLSQCYHYSDPKNLFLDFASLTLHCRKGLLALSAMSRKCQAYFHRQMVTASSAIHPTFMQSATWSHPCAFEYLTGNTKEEEQKKASNEFQVEPLKEIQIL